MAGIAEPQECNPFEGFEEACRSSCAFCGLDVHFGYRHSNPEAIHELPTCEQYDHCDDAVQFMMFFKLKLKSDAGCLERN